MSTYAISGGNNILNDNIDEKYTNIVEDLYHKIQLIRKYPKILFNNENIITTSPLHMLVNSNLQHKDYIIGSDLSRTPDFFNREYRIEKESEFLLGLYCPNHNPGDKIIQKIKYYDEDLRQHSKYISEIIIPKNKIVLPIDDISIFYTFTGKFEPPRYISTQPFHTIIAYFIDKNMRRKMCFTDIIINLPNINIFFGAWTIIISENSIKFREGSIRNEPTVHNYIQKYHSNKIKSYFKSYINKKKKIYLKNWKYKQNLINCELECLPNFGINYYNAINNFELNRIEIINNLLTKKECQYLINFINNQSPLKDQIYNQEISSMIQNKIKYTICDNFLFYIKYKIGESLPKHKDIGLTKNSTKSLIIYLNDDYEGGELEFEDKIYKLNAGSAIIFSLELEHGSRKITKNNKYVIGLEIC